MATLGKGSSNENPTGSSSSLCLDKHELSQKKLKTASLNTYVNTNVSSNVNIHKQVLTFSSHHDPNVKVQLLSTHTLHDLVRSICDNTSIGANGDEEVDDHMYGEKRNINQVTIQNVCRPSEPSTHNWAMICTWLPI